MEATARIHTAVPAGLLLFLWVKIFPGDLIFQPATILLRKILILWGNYGVTYFKGEMCNLMAQTKKKQ